MSLEKLLSDIKHLMTLNTICSVVVEDTCPKLHNSKQLLSSFGIHNLDYS